MGWQNQFPEETEPRADVLARSIPRRHKCQVLRVAVSVQVCDQSAKLTPVSHFLAHCILASSCPW